MARILVADDEPAVPEFLRQALAKVGHEVVAVLDGREVDEVHRKNPVDLVVTDLFMPEQSGLRTIIGLRDHFPDLPIIAISGGGTLGPGTGQDMLQIASKLGAQVIEKPFGAERLREAVDSALVSQQSIP
jgi:CheY-like chemotaxis protein